MGRRKKNGGGGGQLQAPQYHSGCILHFDGACRGNPGLATIGFVIYDNNGRVLEEFGARLGSFVLTNNVAEYKALIAALHHALNLHITHLAAYGDSELVCNQVNGKYKVVEPTLQRYCARVWALKSKFQVFILEYNPRKYNSLADSLANAAFDAPFVEQSVAAEREIIRSCVRPECAVQYVKDQICEGYDRIKFILDTIQKRLPASYAAVKEFCRKIKHEMGLCPECQNPTPGMGDLGCMPCLLAIW
eukprot:Gb_18860 [translate_table: standard]